MVVVGAVVLAAVVVAVVVATVGVVREIHARKAAATFERGMKQK